MTQPFEATLFQRILQPLLPMLEREAARFGDECYKLSFHPWIVNLCYAVISGIPSMRQLATDIKTSPEAQAAGLVVARRLSENSSVTILRIPMSSNF